jgi:hypothetical protein
VKDSTTFEQLAAFLIQLVGRTAIPPDQVRDLIGTGRVNLKAFNMCDGTNTQKSIAKKLRIDQGQLSRTFSRWVESGIAFRVGDRKEARLLHIYPIRQESRGGPMPSKKVRSRRRAHRG